jgi:hypothetical protein
VKIDGSYRKTRIAACFVAVAQAAALVAARPARRRATFASASDSIEMHSELLGQKGNAMFRAIVLVTLCSMIPLTTYAQRALVNSKGTVNTTVQDDPVVCGTSKSQYFVFTLN